MIAVLLCDRDEQERAVIDRDCRKQAAYVSDDNLRVDYALDDSELAHAAEEEKLVNLLYYGFSACPKLIEQILASFKPDFEQFPA